MAGFVPGYDATVVRRLEDAGAVIVGKTVTHEFAYGVNTPPTCTPWNKDVLSGRIERRLWRFRGDWLGVRRHRHRHRRLDSDSGRDQRHRRPQADLRPRQPLWRRSPRDVARSCRPLTRTVEDYAIILQAIAGLRSAPMEAASTCRLTTTSVRRGRRAAGLTIGVERRHFFYDGVAADVRPRSRRSSTSGSPRGDNRRGGICRSSTGRPKS